MKKIGIFIVVCLFAVSGFVSCGGDNTGNNSLNNTFTGMFFTIDCTYDFSVSETDVGAVLRENKTGLEIEVAGIPMMESKKGNTKSLDFFVEDFKKGVEDASVKTIKIDGHKALWIEGKNNGLHGVMAFIPMDGWIIIDGVKKPGNAENSFELSRKIIKSLKITDPEYFDGLYKNPHDMEANDPGEGIKNIEKDKLEKPDNPAKEIDETTDSNNDENLVSNKELPETYSGNFFTIKHPSIAEVIDYSMGDDDMVMFMVDKLNVTIIATKEHEDMTAEDDVGVENIQVSGREAKLFEMNTGDAVLSNCIIEMDGWWVLIMGTFEGSELTDDKETFRAMLESFTITKTDYLKE